MTKDEFIEKHCCHDSSAEFCDEKCDECEKEFRKDLEEHDAQVRRDVIKEVKEFLEHKFIITDETIKGIEKLAEKNMTEQDAIERLTQILEECTSDENAVCYVTDYDELPLRLAIKALEKQIPQEPIIETNDITGRPLKHISYACPRCKVSVNDLINSPYCYCSKCGQAIRKCK